MLLPSGSVIDVLSELVATEFLALMEVSDRLPGLPSPTAFTGVIQRIGR